MTNPTYYTRPQIIVATRGEWITRGGEFRFGTDHPVYLRHALMVMRRFTDEFEWLVDGRDSWENRPSGWCQTRYEKKAREQMGHEVWYFRFRRR